MSNKIVPNIYRAVIDDVIASIKPEFDEFGVSEDVLAELQHKWESKVMASHVAEFETPQQVAATQPVPHPQPMHQPSYPPHAIHMVQTHPHYTNPYAVYSAAAAVGTIQSTVKTEPTDSRYMLNNSYPLPPLPGPNVVATRPPTLPSHPGANAARPAYTPPQPASHMQPPNGATNGQTQQRIPQVDGPSESSDEEDSPSPPPSAFAPRTNHPSLPQAMAAPRARTPVDSEAINSDLDDSDTEGEEDADEGAIGDSDIVFCTYDKVARVKNKWKCILKDGMIHVNGKDYLFAKCTGEFEW